MSSNKMSSNKIFANQLTYLKKRKKTYNLKYSIINHILKNYLKSKSNNLELFGGIGIMSYYIQKNLKPKQHLVIEIDKKTIPYLKKLKKINSFNYSISNSNAFNFKKYENFQNIFIDNYFNLTNKTFYSNIFNSIKNSNIKNLILTETGIFNLKFNKIKTFIHYKKYLPFFASFNLYPKAIFYTSEFSIILLTKIPTQKYQLIKWIKEDNSWKQLLQNI